MWLGGGRRFEGLGRALAGGMGGRGWGGIDDMSKGFRRARGWLVGDLK